MSWLRKRKVAPLPVPATPSMIAATLLDRVQQGNIENVIVLWKTKEGQFSSAYSTMVTTDLLMHEKAVQCVAMDHYKSS